MSDDFAQDERRKQELAGRPIADAIYRRVLQATSIRRFDDEAAEEHILDRKYGIDAEVKLPCGMVLTLQEKFLSHEHSRYNSVTIEHMQDPETGEVGDWGRLAAQLYFIAYYDAQGTGFEKWAILSMDGLVLATQLGKVQWTDNSNKDGHARASFRWADVARLPERCRWYQHGFSN